MPIGLVKNTIKKIGERKSTILHNNSSNNVRIM
jgi:hypothetical protein